MHMLFEMNIGTLGDQLNVFFFSNMSIISDFRISTRKLWNYEWHVVSLDGLRSQGAVLARHEAVKHLR